MPNALVISGGGSKGAFAIGAVQHLVETMGLSFDIVAGTSTGAVIAPMAILGELATLATEYTSVTTDDILEEQPIDKIVSTGCVFGVQPLFDRIKAQITAARFAQIQSSPKHMFLATTCLQTGRITYFATGPNPVSDPDSDLIKLNNVDDLRLAMIASADQPVLMPPIQIPKNGVNQYVDGGVREYAPLSIAIDNGATDVYAVILSPRTKEPLTKLFRRLVPMLGRTIQLLTEDIGYNDLRSAEICTQSVRYRIELRNRLRARFGLTDAQADDFLNVPGAPDPFRDKRVVNLNIIRPAAPLPSEGLDFHPTIMAQMMDMGRTAAAHMEPGGALLA